MTQTNSFLSRYKFTPCLDVLTLKYKNKNVDKVFGKIWRYSNMEESVCTASEVRMAKDLGMSTRTLKRNIKTLLQIGLITKWTSPKEGKKNRGAPNHYTINEEKLKELLEKEAI